jgi:antitoxin HicB
VARRKKKNPHIGSSFESFLEEEGMLESATLKAVKAVIAWQIAQEMKRQNINKTQMAKLMDTSRAQLDRVLDATHDITLDMMTRAASVLKKELVVGLR